MTKAEGARLLLMARLFMLAHDWRALIGIELTAMVPRGMGSGGRSRQSTCLTYWHPPAARNGHCCQVLSRLPGGWCSSGHDTLVLGHQHGRARSPRCGTETVLS